MKQIFTLLAITATLFATKSFGQYSQNFNASNSITSGCNLVVNADRTLAAEGINGTAALYSNPPVNGSSTRDYLTPYLNIVDAVDPLAVTTSFTVSFVYKLSSTLNGQAVRTIEIGLQDKNGVYTTLNTIAMNSANDPIVSTPFNQTFTVSTGVKRLVIKMWGAQGNGSVRIILDDLLVSANSYYTVFGTCNSAPLVLNDVYLAPAQSVYTGSSVLANDGNDPDGEALSTPVMATQSPDGVVVLNPDGTFTFTPNPGFIGQSTSFTYNVSDNGYDPIFGTATVTINFFTTTILPIKLLSFRGSIVENKSQLKWMVDENQTGKLFEVQKSTDGRNFSVIAVVMTTTKTGTENYNYTESISTTTFYRLRLINNDASSSYSSIVKLGTDKATTAKTITVLQNPVAASLQFNFTTVTKALATANIYTMSGAKIMSQNFSLEAGQNSLSLDVQSKLTQGTYLLEVVSSNERNAVKIFKK